MENGKSEPISNSQRNSNKIDSFLAKDEERNLSQAEVASVVMTGTVTEQSNTIKAKNLDMKTEIPDKPKDEQVCRHCGKAIEISATKLISSQLAREIYAWCIFVTMFFCLLWWISWIPFVCPKKCKKSVKMCPHCYRRLNRPTVEQV